MLHNARLSALLESAAAAGGHQLPASLSDVANNPSGALAKITPPMKAGALVAAGSAAATAAVVRVDGGGGNDGGGGGGDVGKQARRRKAGEPPVSREEFERVLAVCRLPYSLTWAEAAYELCMGEAGSKVEEQTAAAYAAAMAAMGSQGALGAKKKKRKVTRTCEQFWASFGAVLVGAREDCDDLLCG